MSYPHETVVSVLIFSHPVIGTTILVYMGVIQKVLVLGVDCDDLCIWRFLGEGTLDNHYMYV